MYLNKVASLLDHSALDEVLQNAVKLSLLDPTEMLRREGHLVAEIALDPEYRWAVVGEPKRRYLWILSRTPSLVDETYASILDRITAHGYDISRLETVLQADASD